MESCRATLKSDDLPIIMSVISRILYGKLISRRGRNSNSGIIARRAAIFAFVSTLEETERKDLLELMLKPFVNLIEQTKFPFSISNDIIMPPLKKQIGFLTLCLDFIKQLRSLIVPSLPKILGIILHLLYHAEKNSNIEIMPEKLHFREIRNLSLKRITLMFSIDLDFNFDDYIPTLFECYIDKRITLFSIENTQSPSALLELFGAWSKDSRYISYLAFNEKVVPQLFLLLTAKKVNDSVILFVLDIVENIQELGARDNTIIDSFFGKNILLLMQQLDKLLRDILRSNIQDIKFYDNSVPGRIITILSKLSPFVKCETNASKLISILIPFLKRPKKSMPENTKCEILHILYNFMEISTADQHDTLKSYYPIICQLFATLESRVARMQIIDVLERFCHIFNELKDLHTILRDLNSFSTKRLDEPDFERKFDAYSRINHDEHQNFTSEQWRPVIYHFIFDASNPEEFSVRASAIFGMTRFIEQAAKTPSIISNFSGNSLHSILKHVLLPSVKLGLKNSSFEVRSGFIQILGKIVESFQHDELVSDMACLLEDKESNFFTNIHHLQVHRQARALRNIAKVCGEKGKIKPANITNIFIPIMSHFIFESDRSKDHNIINEAVSSIASCTLSLSFSHYYATLRRFLNALDRRPLLEKVLIRLLIQILDNFHFEISQSTELMIGLTNTTEDIHESDSELEADQSEFLQKNRIRCIVAEKLLPSLQTLLAVKNDETVANRIPLAVAITRLLKKLDSETMDSHLPKVITALCNILTSHIQSARDSARDTLVTISTVLGPSFLSFIITGLKTSLRRGYQLHVLGFTLHSILSANEKVFKFGSIETCVESITEICMNDIFGEPGKERQVQELKGKMREMKSSKR